MHQGNQARGIAWDLAKSVSKLNNKDKATFYSPIESKETTEMIAAPAPTSKTPEERAFVVDSGASMHMLPKKDLSSDEMDTANGEVQTNKEAQVYVHDFDLFVTLQLLGNTPAVLPLGKLCDEHGYTYE